MDAKKPDIKHCTLYPGSGCKSDAKQICRHCGFNSYEAARRRKLPFVRGRDGLLRKIVGKEKQDD